jgi:hypothetical protein
LFSRDDVASLLNDRFEPVWQSVRPVPIVRVDFGNGTVLTRTLHGNIVTYVCDADGLVVDALPGLYQPATYRDRLERLGLLASFLRTRPPGERAPWLRDYHQQQAARLARGENPDRVAADLKTVPVTKGVIERPLERTVASLAPAATSAAAPAALTSPEDVARWKELAEDTRLNEGTRRRQVHEILAAAGPVTPERVSRRLYKEVLHADLDDPYLGLGPTLFASYPFAREDGGPGR